MNILITGAKGFVGSNLCAALKEIKNGHDRREDHVLCADPAVIALFEYDISSTPEQLDHYCAKADFVFHLAGVNRPEKPEQFMEGNFGFSSVLLEGLKKHHNRCPIVVSSSVQASLEGRFAGSEYDPRIAPAREKILTVLPHLQVTSSAPGNIEIMSPVAGKGSALARVAEHFGLTRENVMAVGDAANDLNMLEYAYHSVAMGNATPEVRACCRYQTATNDECGVAKIIERVIEAVSGEREEGNV